MLGYLPADIICSEKRTVFRERGSLFRSACHFENWGIFSDIPQFWLEDIRSRDAFRPITRKQKDFMDYNLGYPPVLAGGYSVT